MLALVGVTAIWGYTFVPVQKAVAIYPLFAFLAVRFAISTLVLAPFAWRSLWRLPRRGLAAGAVAGALLAAAYGLQTAGLDRTTVASTGFITGLYVVLTPLLALVLFRTPVAAAAWAGVALAVVGLLLLNGVPGGSALGNALVLGNAVAQSFQIVAMERFAPRYDARALTFLQMAVACVAFTVIALSRGELDGAPRRQRLVRARRHRRVRRRARLPRRDVGAVAHDGGPGGARLHARGAVRRALRRAAPVGAARSARLGGMRGDADRDRARRARGGRDAAPARAPARARLMDAVVLALCSAALFGGMTVALRPALARGDDPLCGALLTVLPALGVALVSAAIVGDWDVAAVWPFALAGILAPGVSQVLFTFAIRDAGPSRTSATVGMAPLFAVTFAVVLLGEPLVAGIALGAVLIVAGGVVLASESDRPEHVKTIGLVFALAAALVFASRDTLVRWVAIDSDVAPELAISATLLAGALTILAAVIVGRRRLSVASWPAFVPAGLLFGLSYVSLYEAFFRGKLSVVAPLVATESLWGVGLSALFLRHIEGVGRRLVVGACFVVAGGILIGLSR